MITVPTTGGQTASVTWTGTIPPGVGPSNSCSAIPPALTDFHDTVVTVPAGAYGLVRAEFKFTINWPDALNDEILTVLDPSSAEVGSSDGGENVEQVIATNLSAGTYRSIACAFASATAVNYTGKLEITTTSLSQGLPSAPANGLEFSAAVAADNQRDEAEPLIEIDRAGNIYTCGPTGFSNASDYAQVSTDGGDQFHLLGTPPRGQQGSGGGGDCGLATGVTLNIAAPPAYTYAYTGLGPLTGFVSSVSPDRGHTLVTGGPQAAGITSQGGGADRQWQTFIDSDSVLLIYNQQAPRNVVVQRSDDGGLTYSPIAPIAAPDPRFPGPIKYNETYTVGGAQGLVYIPWEGDGNTVKLSVSTDQGATWKGCQIADAIGDLSFFAVADHDTAGNIYVAYTDGGDRHTYLVTVPVANLANCDASVATQPTKQIGASSPLQVDRDDVRSTVFPWLAAGGVPGRVAVSFYGTPTDGNPDLGTFNATWHVYVNQSLNALDPVNRTFSQVKATTHPFHYDSICLQGLNCDLSVPPGDRSLADFFAMGYNRVNGKLSVVFNRTNKRPDEDAGHVATPMVTTQIGGPSNGGTTLVPDANHQVVRALSNDPTGDALAKYSATFPATTPPPGGNPGPVNVPAGDFTQATIGPELDLQAGGPTPTGGITVTFKLADLSAGALQQALTETGSQSLLWIWRFTNGHQDAAVSARWNLAQGFTYGFNNFTTGAAPCEAGGNPQSEKCILYPGGTALEGKADQAAGTLQVAVPKALLKALSGPQGPGERPTEVPAVAGSRLYDGTAFSLGNTQSAVQTVQSWLYPLDNTPAMDFVIPAPTGVTLRTFAATRSGRGVLVRWRTASEVGNLGFNVYRSKGAARVKLNRMLISSPARGAARGHAYALRDRAGRAGTRYWLQEVHLDGKRVLRGPVTAR